MATLPFFYFNEIVKVLPHPNGVSSVVRGDCRLAALTPCCCPRDHVGSSQAVQGVTRSGQQCWGQHGVGGQAERCSELQLKDHTSSLFLVCLQSPPKLNEVSSDANRENAAVESGSESSSQEATPEKGMLPSHRCMGLMVGHLGG